MYKKVLVTGADGFIGSHLTEFLVKKGYNVKAFCLYNSFNSLGFVDSFDKNVKDSLDIFTGDIRDPNGLRNALKGCDAVLNLAALIAIPFSYVSPDSYVDTNIKGCLNILQASRDLDVEKIVQTSTSEVYGSAQYVPIDEKHPLHPQSPYAATKVASDELALSFYRSFNTPVAIIRPFNTYGPRQSARAVIPTIITQIANGAKKIKLGAISPTRDFNYVLDTVSAFEAVLNSDKAIGEVLNAGSNYEVSIGDTAKIIAKLMDRNIEIETDEKRLRPENSEVNRLWCDNSKLKAYTKWQAQYANLDGFERGLKETIKWFLNKDNLSLYKAFEYNI